MIEDNGTADSPARRVLDLKRTDRALVEGIRAELERHVRLGHRVAIWRDDRVTWLEPEELKASLDAHSGAFEELPPKVIERYREQVRFFANAGRAEREEWVLKRWLSNRSLNATAEVQKTEAPDFIVDGQPVEVVEVQRPGRRRHDEQREDLALTESGMMPPPREDLALGDSRTHGWAWILKTIESKSDHYALSACDWLLLVYANFSWSGTLDYEPLRRALRASPPVFRTVEVLTGDGSAVYSVYSR